MKSAICCHPVMFKKENGAGIFTLYITIDSVYISNALHMNLYLISMCILSDSGIKKK